jgi:8-oxo-dGTP pyrophosphatase MutT (NUDIX family)
MKYKDFYSHLLESIEDDIEAQKGEFHVSAGNDSRFWGDRGAGVLVHCKKTNRFLLGLRSPEVNEPNTWGTFGGKIDRDADPEQAATRELSEETGYKEDIEMVLLDVFSSGTFKFYNFIGYVSDEFKPKLDWENSDAKWFLLDEFPETLHFGLKRLIPKIKQLV